MDVVVVVLMLLSVRLQKKRAGSRRQNVDKIKYAAASTLAALLLASTPSFVVCYFVLINFCCFTFCFFPSPSK